MKVLLDEMLPIGVREFLPSHEVESASHAGLAGISNGEMIRRAIDAGFDVIVTLDRGISHQQNLAQSGVAFVLIPHNDVDRIRRYADDLRRAVDGAAAGLVVRVEAPDDTSRART